MGSLPSEANRKGPAKLVFREQGGGARRWHPTHSPQSPKREEGLRGTEGKGSLTRADKGPPGDEQLCLRPAPVGRNQLSHIVMEPTGPRGPFRSRALGMGSSRKCPRDQPRGVGGSLYQSSTPAPCSAPPVLGPHPGWEVGREDRQTDRQTVEVWRKREGRWRVQRQCDFHQRTASKCI